MYNVVSEELKNQIEKLGGRTFYPRIRCSSFSIDSGIKSIKYNGGSNSEEGITVGSTVSASIEVTTEKISNLITKEEFEFDLGMETSKGIEYIPMGIFKAEKPKNDDYQMSFTAYDRMSSAEKKYNSSLTYPTNTIYVMKEIAEKLGIDFVTDIEAITLNNPSKEENASNLAFAGYTIREAIGYIAGLYGKFAIFNRLGQLEFRWYEYNNYEVPISKTYSFTKNESNYFINKIVGISADDTKYEAGSGIMGISFSNPFVTKDVVDNIYSEIGNFYYRAGEINFLGDCRIDSWDIILATDLYGNKYRIPVMEITHEIDGGLTTTITAKSTEEQSVDDKFKGPTTRALERTHAELFLVNQLIASKASIEYLEANYIKTDELDAVSAKIEEAVITNLQGEFATIEYLEANYASIAQLNAATARIGVLETTALTSNSAVIQTLQTGVADINTLMFGSASGGSIQTSFSNSVIAQLGDAQIKSAMIAEVDAGKITSGSIYTNKVNIFGDESGKLSIVDNTIAISDGTQMRVQIGKDASSDYNMYVWDKSGNLMFDALGLTEDGVTRKIIRDDIVKDDANISAEKLNIESLFNVINEDGSHTLKSSKIYVDADNQTLDVSFKNMTTNIATVTTSVDNANNVANSALASANTANATANTASTNATSALDKATQANTKVDNLQVGGRNLATNTNKGTSGWFWSMHAGNYTASEVVENGVRTCKLTRGTTAQSGWSVIGYRNIGRNKWEANTTYTFSVEVKASVSTTIYLDFKLANAEATLIQSCTAINNKTIANEWRKLIWVVKSLSALPSATEQIAYMDGHNSNVGVWYQFKNLKLEKGNKATDWTPAPEDVDSSISAVDDKVTTVTETVTTQGTQISTIQGQISSKIWQSDITTAVSNVQIGGTNLLRYMNMYTSSNKYSITATTNDHIVITKGLVYLEAGKTYTFSCKTDGVWGEFVGDDTVEAFLLKDGSYSYYIGMSTNPKTFVPTQSGTYYLRLDVNQNGKTHTFWNIQIEEGNKATSWKPCYIDTESSITTLSDKYTTLDQSLDGISATVASHTTQISAKADSSTVTAVQSKITTLEANLDGYKTTVSSTYATQSALTDGLAGKKSMVYHNCSSSGGTAGYFHLAQLVIIGNYANQALKFVISNRNNQETTFWVQFSNVGNKDPGILRFQKTGTANVYIFKAAASTWNIYVKKSEAYDNLAVTDYSIGSYMTDKIHMVWKDTTITSALSWQEAQQLSGQLPIDTTNGGTSGSGAVPTSGALYTTTTIANQTAQKFQWIVQSGTSSSDFTLTDRMASLTASIISLNGDVKVNGDMLVDGAVTADKISVTDLNALEATIGGFTIGSNSIQNGTWGTDNSVLVCTGSTGSKSIGGSASISGWCFTAGSKFGVTKAGALYASSANIEGTFRTKHTDVDCVDISGNGVIISGSTGRITYLTEINMTDGSEGAALLARGKASCLYFGVMNDTTAVATPKIVINNGANIGDRTEDVYINGTTYFNKKAYVNGVIETPNQVISSSLELISAKPYIDFHFGSSTADYTSRIIEKVSGTISIIGNLDISQNITKGNTLMTTLNTQFIIQNKTSGGYIDLACGSAVRALNIAQNGYVAMHASSFVNQSSRRYKNHLGYMSDFEANKLMNLNVVNYDYINGEKGQYGLYAEDVETIIPTCVYKNTDGLADGIDYTKLIPYMIKKIQMQQKEISNLKNLYAHLIGYANA